MPVALPSIRPNFLGGMGRNVALSDTQKRAILSWGTEYRARLRKVRESDPAVAECTRDGVSAPHGLPSVRNRSPPAFLQS